MRKKKRLPYYRGPIPLGNCPLNTKRPEPSPQLVINHRPKLSKRSLVLCKREAYPKNYPVTINTSRGICGDTAATTARIPMAFELAGLLGHWWRRTRRDGFWSNSMFAVRRWVFKVVDFEACVRREYHGSIFGSNYRLAPP